MHLFSDSINGLVDIRTSKKQEFIIGQMSKTVDFHFRTCVVLSGFGEWFRIRVTLSSIFVTFPAFVFVLMSKDDFLSTISILITVLMMNMDTFNSFMNILNMFEKNFVSFDRCSYYLNLEPESGLTLMNTQYGQLMNGESMNVILQEENQLLKSEKNWLFKGQVSFRKVCADYAPDLNYVLKNLNFEIRPSEKIGVIGRTGAGKSSLVIALVRFFESIEGEINIDGLDIYKLDVKKLRRSMTYISQDSYFFEGTLRENLDPFKIASDDKIVELLKESEIYDKIDLSGGLDWKLSSGGGNISVGEKQILCFVRAIINIKKIIIMDEATLSLDIKSESLIEKMKEKYFKESTTITIAHRLNTVYQSDRILVLDKGKIRTFGNVRDFTGVDMEYFNNYIKQMII
jgi:ABC-type multidrug transport system fused ATPase/permease subunit